MKDSHRTTILCVCMLTAAGVVSARPGSGQQSAPATGRFQLFQGKYQMGTASGVAELNGVFKIDTQTGRTYEFYAGQNAGGQLDMDWLPTGVK